MIIKYCSALMARRRGLTRDDVFRIWLQIQTQSPKQKVESSCGVFVLMVRVRLFRMTFNEMGTSHRCDRVTQAPLCLHSCISKSEYLKNVTVSITDLIITTLFIFSSVQQSLVYMSCIGKVFTFPTSVSQHSFSMCITKCGRYKAGCFIVEVLVVNNCQYFYIIICKLY